MDPELTPRATAIDPVCGMTIATAGAITREFEGATYYFCAEICASRFDVDAIAYVRVARLDIPGWGRTPTPGFLMPEDRA
jgi:YHS domain-containing protein